MKTVNTQGLYGDCVAQFLNFMEPIIKGHSNFAYFLDFRIRNLSNFVMTIPFNIIIQFLPGNIDVMYKTFIFSCYFMIYLSFFINFPIAFRTQRFDIAAWAFIIFGFFIINGSLWFTREPYICIMASFGLLSYFLSKRKLEKPDLIPITILLFFLSNSFETAAVFGVILFIASIFYYKKSPNEMNIKFKLYIGITGLLIVIYMLIAAYMLVNLHVGSVAFINTVFEHTNYMFKAFFKTTNIISLLGVLLLIKIFFDRNKPITHHLPFIVISSLIFICYFYAKTQFRPDIFYEHALYLIQTFIYLPILTGLILLDYFKIDIENHNKYFYSNLIAIGLLISFLQISFQIYQSYTYSKYVTYLKAILNSKKTPLAELHPLQLKPEIRQCFWGTDLGLYSLVLSNSHKVKSILIPHKKLRIFPKGYRIYLYYKDENDERIYLNGRPTTMVSPYWDLNDIGQAYKEKGWTANNKSEFDDQVKYFYGNDSNDSIR